MAVLQHVPLLIQNARAISLEIVTERCSASTEFTLGPAICALAACSYVIKPSILRANPIDLGAIAVSFPSLEILKFYSADNFHRSLEQLR